MKKKIVVGEFLYESLTEEEFSQFNSIYDHVLGKLGYKVGEFSTESGSGEEYSKRVGKADIVFDDLSYNDEGKLSLSFGIRYGSHYLYSQRIFLHDSKWIATNIHNIDKELTAKATKAVQFIDQLKSELDRAISAVGTKF